MLKHWISAFRLRTLPLSFSSIIVGSAIALYQGSFSNVIFILCLTTTLFLQILSNLANDLGDFIKGTDNEDRLGPTRTLQAGKITVRAMKRMITFFAALSIGSGASLLIIAGKGLEFLDITPWIILGILAVFAALFYTLGKRPYGYQGLGDIAVFIFFGIVGVFGSYFLHSHSYDWGVLFPAATIGFFSTGVLNSNNTRDIENDRSCGKITLAVILGKEKALIYQFALIIMGWTCLVSYALVFNLHTLLYCCAPIAPLFIIHLLRFKQGDYNGQLKMLSISTLLLSLGMMAWSLFFAI